jgi:hypothetical protein
VCKTVWEKLSSAHITETTSEIWEGGARGFYEKWDFLSCIDTTDGKCDIQVPK